ncbi:hypothetical protein T492DRAFT_1039017 [Pavlovales sp. CCMP2436]|nr:hypothetical protein T492DRAFT_1039017 [Pavlovales sp. CCMP2436]
MTTVAAAPSARAWAGRTAAAKRAAGRAAARRTSSRTKGCRAPTSRAPRATTTPSCPSRCQAARTAATGPLASRARRAPIACGRSPRPLVRAPTRPPHGARRHCWERRQMKPTHYSPSSADPLLAAHSLPAIRRVCVTVASVAARARPRWGRHRRVWWRTTRSSSPTASSSPRPRRWTGRRSRGSRQCSSCLRQRN